MDNTIKEYHAEFINILESSKLFSEVKEVEKGRFVLSNTFPTKYNAIMVKTSKGWQPTPVQWVESLLNDIHLFWTRNAQKLYRIIADSESNCIQTAPILLHKGLRKFGCFFDAIIIPDQLLLLYDEHYGDRQLIDWQSLVLSTIRIGATYLESRDLLLPHNSHPRIILVPPRRIIDKEYREQSVNATLMMGERFFSTLCNKDIKHPMELEETWLKNGERSMNAELLNKVYRRYGASSFNEYFQKQQNQSVFEQGSPTVSKNEPKLLQMFLDVHARFSEFERSHGEAFIWGQEAEIPDNDAILFEWWFKESSKTVSYICGTSYSEDELIKFGLQSKQMSFLKTVKMENLLNLIETDPVEELRREFRLSRIRIKRLRNYNLEESINAVGKHMEERLKEFQVELSNIKMDLGRRENREWIDLGVSMVLSAASVFLPPLSAFSAIYGGNLAATNKKKKENRKILESINKRPIATLANWKFNGTTD